MSLSYLTGIGTFTSGSLGTAVSSLTFSGGFVGTSQKVVANTLLIIIVHTRGDASGNPASTVTSITGTNGLTWTQRSINAMTQSNGIKHNQEVWWAWNPDDWAVNKTVITTFNAPADCAICAYAEFLGVLNQTNPWDKHNTGPTTNINSTSSLTEPLNPAFITDGQSSFILVSAQEGGGRAFPVTVTGWAHLNTASSVTSPTGGSLFTGDYAQLFSGPQNIALGAIWTSGTNSAFWIVDTDAITGDAPPVIPVQAPASGNFVPKRKKALEARRAVRNKFYEDRRVKRIPMWPQWLGY